MKAASDNLIGTLSASRNSSPAAIVWLLTYKCNATCNHCDFWKRDQTISENDIIHIGQKIAKSNAFIVNLSGGEIFLIPNIRQVIELLKKAGKYVRINSNGLIIDAYLDFLLKAQVDSVAISIDNISPQQHDANRGKNGTFEKCLKAIDYIKSNRTGKKPEISIRGVVMKNNIDQIEEYINFFSSRVDNICFQPVHNQIEKHKVVDSKVLFNADDEPHVRDVIGKIAAKYDFLDNAYFRSFPDFIFHPDRLTGVAVDFCLPMLHNTLRVNPDGECYICNQSIGNILKEEVEEVWSWPRRKSLLKELAANGKCSVPCWLNSSSAQTTIAGGAVKLLIKMAR